MDLIANYNSDSDNDLNINKRSSILTSKINPDVDITSL